MRKNVGIFIAVFFILCSVCVADENDKLSQVMRVEVDKETILDSQSRLRILLAVSNNLGKDVVIKPKSDFKESVGTIYTLAKQGKTVHSGRFGISSVLSSIKKSWGEPQGEFKEKKLEMVLYKNRDITFKYPERGFRIKEVSCHSFYGSPSLPSMREFKQALGKPLKEYNLLEIIKEGKNNGIDVMTRLQKRGITKKSTNIEEAVKSRELDIHIIIYKAGKYFFYMTECRIRRDPKFYRAVGVRVDANIVNDPWII